MMEIQQQFVAAQPQRVGLRLSVFDNNMFVLSAPTELLGRRQEPG